MRKTCYNYYVLLYSKNKVESKGGTKMKRNYIISKVEWEYIKGLIEAIAEYKIKNQVENNIVWYAARANTYRIFEYTLNAITLISPICLVIINECFNGDSLWGQMVVALISTLASAGKSFSHLHDKKVSYRKTAEEIKNETELYNNYVGEYKGEDRTQIFVQKLVQIRKTENANWQKIEGNKKITDSDKGE